MASRAVIEQAKGVIMAMRGVPEHEAFEVLRKSSQDRNVKVRVLAQQIVTGVVDRKGAGPRPERCPSIAVCRDPMPQQSSRTPTTSARPACCEPAGG